ncbi:alkaline phosphatase [Brevundimonas sp.]|uniref:alkaline phosphatase D family protein n=1 Tax=Brevundimonas sp. TaxID=1871086 RepID=UPI002737B675|nr:alkaline phosphatase D family protein [Brevundimonas sp.]MDP3802900.1 alkaline phosphatase D family protein [Brevundimonas sp.]
MDKSALSRRAFAAQAAALGAALAFGPASAHPGTVARRERRDLFPQGVASGDPRADSVILWTRRAPDSDRAAHRLTVEVARDPGFANMVARGDVAVTAATDWTCRFLAAGLSPAREHWYRFVDEQGNTSRIGRTLTAPADDDDRAVKFAFVSCQDVTQGALNAYRRMLYEDVRRPREDQLGFVLHLGDFIYELVWYAEERPGGVERGRRLRDIVRYPTGEKVETFHIPADLEDYRTAYRGYLLDPDLQDARARWPFVPVWDNHEFNWRSYQSQRILNGEISPAQTLKVAASQAWYEYQPARVRKPGSGDVFEAPAVENMLLAELDARGTGLEPNNLAAIKALQIQRAFRYGKNVDMILTDNRSYGSPGGSYSGHPDLKFGGAIPEDMYAILDEGRDHGSGSPPAMIRVGGADFPNPNVDAPPEAYLGLEQMAWFKDRLRAARAPWKIWGHSFGTLTGRTDPQNLPPAFADRWPTGAGYGIMQGGGYRVEHAEIFDMIRGEGITGFTIVAGDKHAFWAGYPSKTLPPLAFDPVGVEFVTGSISSQTFAEVQQLASRERPLRPFYLRDRLDGTAECAFGMTLMHGVQSTLALHETGDPAQARAARNPELAPHLRFMDFAGHGYTTVRASADELETEFVCIPIPHERSETEDGGPLVYRVAHRVSLWQPGERPELRQEVLEGDPGLAI